MTTQNRDCDSLLSVCLAVAPSMYLDQQESSIKLSHDCFQGLLLKDYIFTLSVLHIFLYLLHGCYWMETPLVLKMMDPYDEMGFGPLMTTVFFP